MSGLKLTFVFGDQLKVIGAKVRIARKSDVIAREIVPGDEDLVFLDRTGNLLMTQ